MRQETVPSTLLESRVAALRSAGWTIDAMSRISEKNWAVVFHC